MQQTEYADRVAANGAEAVAKEFGLHRIGARPKLGQYLKSLWARRQFLWSLSTAKAYAQNRDNHLGQLWSVLNPLLWAAVYGLIFGLIMGGRQNMTATEYIPFLVVGIFVFRYMGSCMTTGAKAIQGNISLVRSLHFPRAIMPISVALSELIILLPGLAVMGVIIIACGQGPGWSWLLFPAVVLLFWMFGMGLALIMARLVVQVRDLANLLQFINRLLFYTSGVIFPIDRFAERFQELGIEWVQIVGLYQPFAVYLTLARTSLTDYQVLDKLGEPVSMAPYWGFGVGYSLLFLIVGFIFFWRAEERYGRD